MPLLPRPPVWLPGAIGLIALAAQPGYSGQSPTAFAAETGQAFSVPLLFAGDDRPQGIYVASAGDLRATFLKGSIVLERGGQTVSMRFPGSREGVYPEGARVLPGRMHVLTGDNPGTWRRDLPLYEGVVYRDLYRGVDAVYSGSGKHLKSEFRVRPGADPAVIRMSFEGASGVRLSDDGELVVSTAGGELREQAPRIYADADGARIPVSGSYRLFEDGSVGFAVGDYDSAATLVIDPEMTYSTYLGGSYLDYVMDAAVDAGGNVYLTGWTESANFPVVNPIQSHRGSNDVFVVKINASGGAIAYATFLGGSSDDRGYSLAVDGSGNVTVTGYSASTNFPTQAAAQGSNAGGRDAFVLKLNAAGSALVFSTYLGGSGQDAGQGVAVDTSGNVYVAGDTYSTNFPILNPYQSLNAGSQDAFIAKYSDGGLRLYSTLLGGAGDDYAAAIAVNSSGLAYVTGGTTSSDFPTLSAFQASKAAGQDVFVSKLAAAGNQLYYSTFVGGAGGALGSPEAGADVAVDSSGNAYVAGTTSSTNFPVSGIQTQYGGGAADAFVFKLGASGNTLVYSTYLGGNGSDFGASLAIRESKATVAGHTSSPNFPTLDPMQSQNAGQNDAFVSRLGTAGTALELSSYFGGSLSDGATAVALDSSGNTIVAGTTQSTDLPTRSPIQATNAGILDSFVTKFGDYAPAAPQAVSVSPSSGSGDTQSFRLTFSDTNGYQEMNWTFVLFQTQVVQSGACYVQYNRSSNIIWLRNDTGTGWLGPLTVGAPGTLQNSQCTVDAQQSSANGSGSTLTVDVALIFTAGFAGTQNIYMLVGDTSGLDSGWQMRGAWTTAAQQAPQAVSISPSSGSGSAQTFRLTYSDVNGYQQIGWAFVLLNTSISAAGGCYIQYNHSQSTLWLQNDAGTGWLGPLVRGSPGTLQNSQCTLDAEASTASGAGATLTVDVALTFKAGFQGAKNVYMYAADTAGLNSGWQQRGTWTPDQQYAPQAVSVSPSSGSGASQLFRFTYSDQNGYQQIGWAFTLFQTAVSGANACYVQYIRSQDTLWLLNDAGTAWLGPIAVGAPGTLQNSQCTLDAQTSAAAGSGNTLTLDLALTFKTAFTGTKNTYMYVADTTGLNSTWQTRGTWLPEQASAPQAVSVNPSSGTGGQQTFTFTYSDQNGYQQMGWTFALFNSTINGAGACYFQYNHGQSTLWLRDDADATWLGPISPGAPGNLQNSQCIVDGEAASAMGSGSTLTLAVALTFKNGFTGTRNVYMYAADTSGLNSDWQQRGTWTPQPAYPPVAQSVTPSSGSGSSQMFTFTYSDQNGSAQLGWAHALIHTQVAQANSCYVQYLQGTNSLWLRNDAGTGWLGPLTPSQAGTLRNSQCLLNVEASSVSTSATTLTLNLSLFFTPIFSGVKSIYMYVADSTGLNSGWQTRGTWDTATPYPPVVVLASPNSGSGPSERFRFWYRDLNGATEMNWVFGLFQTSVVASNACYFQYNYTQNQLYLLGDSGTAWMGPIVPGTTGTLANGQCSLDATQSGAVLEGVYLILDVQVTFNPSFTGVKKIYGLAADTTGRNSGWTQLGLWTPYPNS